MTLQHAADIATLLRLVKGHPDEQRVTEALTTVLHELVAAHVLLRAKDAQLHEARGQLQDLRAECAALGRYYSHTLPNRAQTKARLKAIGEGR